MVEQFFAAGIDHRKDFFKALVSGKEVGVRDVVAAVAETAQFVNVCQAELFEVGNVIGVKPHDHIETLHVIAAHLPGAQGADIEPVFQGHPHRIVAGRFADMPGPGPGGIDKQFKTPALGLLPRDGLRQRRTADIPQADKEHGGQSVIHWYRGTV